jgi:hypothetical protein
MAKKSEPYPDNASKGATSYASTEAISDYSTTDQRSLGQLFSELSADLSDLLHKEVMLAQAEATEKVTTVAKGAGMAVAGGFVAYAGFIVLLLALAYLLERWMDLWLATALVAVVVLIVGAVLLQMGRSKLKNMQLKPEQTIDSLKENVEWAKEQVR